VIPFNRNWLALEGYAFPAFQARLEAERVTSYLDFAGRGDDPALKARAARDIGPVIPTLPFSLEMNVGVVPALADLLDIPSRFLLHAEQRFDYPSVLQCGDRVTVESCLRRVSWKPKKQVCFFEKETQFFVARRLAVNSLSVYAVRARQNRNPAGSVSLE